MLGKKLLWVSKQHGHSVQVMLAMYATWIDGNGAEAEVAAIEAAMTGTSAALAAQLEGRSRHKARTLQPLQPPAAGSSTERTLAVTY